MSGTTYTYIGPTASAVSLNSASYWTPTLPAGTQSPGPGEDIIYNAGTAVLNDASLRSQTLFLGGGTLDFYGDAGARSASNPAVDSNSAITTDAAQAETVSGAPQTATIDAYGNFVNEGSIVADGPAGSVLTINIAETTAGTTTLPGYFYNSGTIIADAGNTLIINVGSASESFNTGSIVADGGTVIVNVAAGAISGGDAPVSGFEVIEGGGTLITAASYPASDGNNGTSANFEFGDSTPGNTLKIENIGSFGDTIIGFAAGDTIDIGTLLSVGTLTYSTTTSFLVLESATGATLDTLRLGNFGTGVAAGTFAVVGGSADGFDIGVGADGDTIITTSGTLVQASGNSGAWQSTASWLDGVVPGTTASVSVGLGASTPFILTTGSTSVSVGGIGLYGAPATVEITSNTTLTTGQISDYAGTVDIIDGSTLIGGKIGLYQPSTALTIAAGSTADLSGRINPNLEPSGGVWNIQPGGNASAFFVSAGTAVVDGSLLAGPPSSAGGGGGTAIGYESDGQSATVIVNAGGTVTDTHTTIGSDPTSAGTLVLNGAGASWTDLINAADTYTARGNITVGYNDVALNTPANLPAPTEIGTAQVLVENGATLTDQEGGSIGSSIDSSGAVTIETGGLWNLAYNGVGGGVSVGSSGEGTLSILNGGTVTVGAILTYLSSGSIISSGGIGVGQVAGSNGTIVISGTSYLSTLNGISVGKGGQGLLDILNGGTFVVGAGGISAGTTADAGSSGTIIVGGTGAAAFVNMGTGSGGMTIGSASQGTLIVTDNGTINMNGTGYLTIGSSAGSFGTVVVGGNTASAVINLGTDGLTVGNNGTGYLTVNSLGTITLTGNDSITIGQNAGAVGTATVDGGSLIQNTSTAYDFIGLNNGANGSLLIENGGLVSLNGNGINIANGFQSTGSVTVTGPGSILETSSKTGLTVGSGGNGTLTITNGGSVNAGGGLVAGQNGGTGGLVSVDDATVTASAIAIGNYGTGALAISGGTVITAGTLGLGIDNGGTGIVTLSGTGGTLIATGGIEIGGGGSGTLLVQGDTVTTSNLSLGGSRTAPLGFGNTNSAAFSAGADVAVTGALTVWQGSTVSLDGTSGIDVGTSGTDLPGKIYVENGSFLNGNGVVAAPVVNDGLIQALGSTAPNSYLAGTLDIQGAVTGSGSMAIGPDGILELDATPPLGQPIAFGSGSELILNDPGTTVTNPLTGLSDGDKIELNLGAGNLINNVTEQGTTVTVFTNAGSYVLTDVSFAAGSGTSFYSGSDPSTGDDDIQVATPYANWTGNAGDTLYSDAGNWQPDQVPNATDSVSFNSNPGTVTGTGTALNVNFGSYNSTNFENWTLTGISLVVAGSPNAPYLPNGLGFYTNVVVNGGTLNAAGGTSYIGNVDGVTVTVENGAKVTTMGDSVATNSGQSGSLVLTGPGTDWTELGGAAINGSQPGFMYVGGNGSGGGLTGSTGYLTVTDNAELNTQGNAGLTFGNGGEGYVTVSAGGVWTIGNGLNVGNGSLTINAGTVNSTGYVTLAQSSDSSGTIAVSAGGTLSVGSGMTVGQGGAALITVNGGAVTATGYAEIGQQYGASGTITIQDGTFAAGGFTAGDNGSGTIDVGAGGTLLFGGTFNRVAYGYGSSGLLDITNGGTAKATGPAGSSVALAIGGNGASSTLASANGGVDVSGPGSLLNLNGNGLIVGYYGGNGGLFITQGATVDAGVTNSTSLSSALVAGLDIGSNGVILVSGTGTALNLTGGVGLGSGGSVTMLVGDDAVVNILNAPTVSNGGVGGLGIGDDLPADTGTTNGTIGGEAQVTVTTHGTLSIQSGFGVGGDSATGVLDVNDGGTVVTGTGFTVGTASETSGTIYAGTGSINIGAGGTILVTAGPDTSSYVVNIGTANANVSGGATDLATGVITVSGAGALLDTNGNAISVGIDSDGILTIGPGGVVETGTPNSGDLSAISIGRQGDGAVTVNEGTLLADGNVYIGRAGTGNLVVENHGSLNVGLDGTGSTSDGDLDIGGAGVGSGTVVYAGGTGSMQVATGGTVTTALPILVGDDGTTGNLSIADGLVETDQKIFVGNSTTVAAGDQLVTPTGTVVATAPTTEAGDGSVEIGPNGTLLATAASFGSSPGGTSSIIIGQGTGATANVTVEGAGALLSAGDNRLGVGDAGEGSLTIAQGGSVFADSSAVGNIAMYIGSNDSGAAVGTGAVTVTDPGSALTAVGQLDIGYGGYGSLLIENDGTVFTGDSTLNPTQGFDISSSVGPSGEAVLSGAGSALWNTGRFIVGDVGLGSLSIEAGATVVTTPGTVAGLAGAVIGNGAGASGSSVNVTGTGSNWQIAGTLNVGLAGAGALSVTNGGSVAAGAIDAGTASGGFGDIVVNGSASQLTATGDFIVGDRANADVALNGGGTISAGAIDIGLNPGASGVVDVEGDSVLNAAGVFNVGDAGNAVLSLGADATVNATSFNIGTAGVLVEFGDPINSGTVTNSNSIVVAGGSNTTTASVRFVDNGLVEVENSGTETITTPLITNTGSLTGTMQISTGGELVLNAGSVAATQTIQFADATGTLLLGPGGIGGFDAVIQDFVPGDTIIVDTYGAATFSQTGSVVSVVQNGTTLGVLTFDTATNAGLAYTTAGALVDNALCFLAGTLIGTPDGERPVQDLAVGDRVLTASGVARPVVWVGQGRVLATRGRRGPATPVIVRKGALGANVPHRDLHVTKGHALLLDGVLIPVEFLVNHRSVLWDDRAQEVVVYHVELATHDVLVANGAAAESYRDDGNRWLFANANAGWDQPPKPACAPVLTGGAVVDAVWRRLLERAGPRPSVPLTDEADVHLMVDGVRVEASTSRDGIYVFSLRSRPDAVRIVSRAAVPQELGVARDPRLLGVALRRVVVRQGTRFRTLGADDAALTEGVHAFEPDAGVRWTDGDAALPAAMFDGFPGACEVVVHLGGTATYIDDGDVAAVA